RENRATEEAVDGDLFPLELRRVRNFVSRNQDLVHSIRGHCYGRDFSTCQRGLDRGNSAGNDEIETAADQRLRSHRAAPNENEISVETMLVKKTGFFSYPDGCIRRRKIGVANDEFATLSVRAAWEKSKGEKNRREKYF